MAENPNFLQRQFASYMEVMYPGQSASPDKEDEIRGAFFAGVVSLRRVLAQMSGSNPPDQGDLALTLAIENEIDTVLPHLRKNGNR